MREGCPVAWRERAVLSPGGFWTVSRYGDVVSLAVAADRSTTPAVRNSVEGRPPLEVDRPEHTFYRRSCTPTSPRSGVGQLEGRIRAFVGEMLAAGHRGRRWRPGRQLTYPLPARTLCAWLGLARLGVGVPTKRISDELFNAEEGRGNDPETVKRCAEALDEYSRRLVDERVRNPRDPELDLISGIIGKTDGERTVTADDAVQLVRLLLVAGHNSTTSALGNCVMRIAADHGLQTRLRSAPELVPAPSTSSCDSRRRCRPYRGGRPRTRPSPADRSAPATS